VAKERARLTLPASADEVAKLAGHYTNSALGNISVKRSGDKTVFAWDGGESQIATRKNDDGTISFVTTDPPLSGLEFVNAARAGKQCLILRDAQHEYVFTEAS
jgi:hypothetical protein